jgi:hypothetical protein
MTFLQKTELSTFSFCHDLQHLHILGTERSPLGTILLEFVGQCVELFWLQTNAYLILPACSSSILIHYFHTSGCLTPRKTGVS